MPILFQLRSCLDSVRVADPYSLPPKPRATLSAPARQQTHLIPALRSLHRARTLPQPEQLGVGQWTQSQLLSPETLPSVAAVGASGRERQANIPTGDGASLAWRPLNAPRGSSLGLAWHPGTSPYHQRPFPLHPPHSGWQEAGPVSANQQPDSTRALSSVALATSSLFWIPLLYTW